MTGAIIALAIRLRMKTTKVVWAALAESGGGEQIDEQVDCCCDCQAPSCGDG